jgi:predicted ATPase/DNA-binding CsgD family transcriptional regulator
MTDPTAGLAHWRQVAGVHLMARDQRTADVPVGTVTFLLTRIEEATVEHVQWCGRLIAASVAAHHGVRVDGDGAGDTAVALFASADEAVAAALDIQRAINRDASAGLVRIGLHTGEARTPDRGTATGLALQRGVCLRDVAYGGQTLLSSVTATIVTDALPAGAWLCDLGAHRLRDLSAAERVFELRHPELADDFPPLRSLDVLANNLPVQLTSFIGRADELAAVQRFLGHGQLVTLTGSGGCGKTRLAAQAAATLADRWPDGVWWVDLGPVTDPTRVAELAASSTRVMVEPVGGALRALTLQLRDRNLLVCLDNCEHLLDASAELAEVLLRSCPEVSVLATSRERLGVAGETVWRVPSMVEDEAVSLFAQRASQVQPGFAIDDSNEDAVRTVCQRLDGIPLAVELAAAWLRALSPAQIAAGLDDRFRLLAGGARGVVARQQTLTASVEWSYDLLDEPDRAVFRQLAVFTGGFNIDAARAVCVGPGGGDDVLVAIGRLADKSLVVVDQHDDEARYRMLETIRQYAHDRLRGDAAATRDRHLDHFLALAETAEPELERADQDAWLAMLETEHDNLRGALDWGLSAPEPERGRRLAAALPRLWLLHGHSHEGIGYLKRAIALNPDDGSSLQARLLVGAALVGATGGQFGLTVDAARQGLDLATANGDDRNRGRCLNLQAYIHVYFDFARALELSAQARACAEAAGDAWGTDLGLLLEGLALTNCDRHQDARPILDAAVERCRRHGDRILAAFALVGRMEGALRTGDLRTADRLGTEAVRLAEPLGDYFTVGFTTCNLAWVKGAAGDLDAGLRLMDTVVRSVEGAAHAVDIPAMAVSLGQLHLWGGDLEGAAAWFTQALRYGEPFVDNLIVARALPGLAAAYRRLREPDTARKLLERAVALARRLDLPRMLAEALDESAVLVAAEDLDRAEDLHHEALSVRVGHGLRTFYVDSLDALARNAAGAERCVEAARLFAASDAARELMGYPRPLIDKADYNDAVAALRASLGDNDFHTAWSEGADTSLDDAVAYISRARGARGRPSKGWASLTPTELKVVGLAVEGLTNPEIAAQLFMSRETVKTHLSHVYTKLDVTNRTELATLAASRPTPPPNRHFPQG